MKRLGLIACVLLLAVLRGAGAQVTTTSTTPATLVAGVRGVTLTTGPGTYFAGSGNGLCFFTGYGDLTPLSPSSATSGSATFDLPDGLIQNIPPSAFASGGNQVIAYVYSRQLDQACSAVLPNTYDQVPIFAPVLSAVLASGVPGAHPAATANLPATVDVDASYFLPGTGSVVQFSAGGVQVNQPITAIGNTAVRSGLPPSLPASAPSATVAVCNQGTTYTYCSNAESVAVVLPSPVSGTLAVTPSPSNAGQPVNLTASFSPAAPGIGVPYGTATFSDGATGLGTAKLQLSLPTAVFRPGAPLAISNDVPVSTCPGPQCPAGSLGSRQPSAGPRLKPRPRDQPLGQQQSVIPYLVDFNHDGIPDLVLSYGGSNLQLYLGTAPAGSFAYEGPLNPCPNGYITDLAFGDLDGDGYPDIAMLCGGQVSVAYSQAGLGSFRTVTNVGPSQASQIALGDLNGDRKLDIVTAGAGSGNSGFTTYLQRNGTFPAAGTTWATSYALGSQLTLADFNGDGLADIAISSSSPYATSQVSGVQVFPNGGGGNFANAVANPVVIPISSQLYSAAGSVPFYVAPLSPGALPSIFATQSGSTPALLLARNTSTASQISFGAPGSVAAPNGLQWYLPGDFNGDGKADLAIYDGTSVSLLLGDGAGAFTAAPATFNVASFPNGVLLGAADQNGDGFTDLVVIDSSTSSSGIAGNLETLYVSGTATATVTAGPLPGGAQTLSASYPGTPFLASSTATANVQVNALVPTVTFPAPPGITYGTPLSATQLTASATYNGVPVPGSFTFTPAAGTVLGVGKQNLSVVFTPASATYSRATATTTITVSKAQPALLWATPASIVYGTALSNTQLNAVAPAGIPGALTYNPVAGTVLGAGTHTLSATFVPTDQTDYLTASASVQLTVTQATPTIVWPTPPAANAGTTLPAADLNASATGVSGAVLQGSFVYNPAAGSVITAGAETLSVTFTPTGTDAINYTVATKTVQLAVTPFTVSSVNPSSAVLKGSGAITVSGTGFAPDAAVQVGGLALPTNYSSSSSLSATIPVDLLSAVGTLQISVVEPAEKLVSQNLPFQVSPPPVPIQLNPPTTAPASMATPALGVTLANPYPVQLSGTLTLTFTPAISGGADDPGVGFSSCTANPTQSPCTGNAPYRTYAFTIPQNTTENLNVPFATGSVAGTIQVALRLTVVSSAGTTDVTPASIAPVIVPIPVAAPGINSVTTSLADNVLTVSIMGFSNTREVTQAQFDFTSSGGPPIDNPTQTLPVATNFANWYGNPASAAYGSQFLYTQSFTLSNNVTSIGQIKVTLTNSVGASQTFTAP